MAFALEIVSSKRCSTCGSVAGTCICTGCKSLYCPPHFNEHRQQMSAQLEYIMESCNQLAMRTKDTIQTQRAGSSLLSQIDAWQKTTIEKVSQTADNARQQAIQLMRRKKVEILGGLESIGKEIRTRQVAGDFVEYDIERLKKMTNRLQQDLDQFIRRPIELRLKNSQQIDWNNLIYIDQQSTENLSRNFQAPLTARSQSSASARKDRPASSRKTSCLHVGGCDGCTYVPFGGGWKDGGYYENY